MKKFILFAITLLCVQFARAQWEDDVRLTDDVTPSLINPVPGGNSIAASGDTVHIVWRNNKSGASNIYYMRSLDGGVSWGEEAQLTTGAVDAWAPHLAISGSAVHVSWFDFAEGGSYTDIFYRHSLDGGNT